MKVKITIFKDLKRAFVNYPHIQNLVMWSKAASLPGFYSIPIYDVIAFIIKELNKQDISLRANAMAFSFFLSLFPAIIMLFTLVAYFPIFDNFSELLRSEIMSIMPSRAGSYLFLRIEDIATKQRGGLLSLSFLLVFYFSSNGLRVMMRGFEKSYYRTFKSRSMIQKYVVALRLTALLGLLLIASVSLIIGGTVSIDLIIKHTPVGEWLRIGVNLLSWLALLGLVYFGIAVIYRYGAATKRRMRWFSPGATLATALSLAASLLFSFYVDNFGRYNDLYGPIGAVIVLMLWIQINSFSLLVGFELNASIAVNLDMRDIVEEDPIFDEEETIQSDAVKGVIIKRDEDSGKSPEVDLNNA